MSIPTFYSVPQLSSSNANQTQAQSIPMQTYSSSYAISTSDATNLAPVTQSSYVIPEQQFTSNMNYGNSSVSLLSQYPTVTIAQDVSYPGQQFCYKVLDPNGQQLLTCRENSSLTKRLFLGGSRPMTINVADNAGNPVLTIERPFKWVYQQMSVSDSTGKALGKIQFSIRLAHTEFAVTNALGHVLYMVNGLAWSGATRDSATLFGKGGQGGTFTKLSILNSQGSEVGNIDMQWNGWKKGVWGAQCFTLTFPPEADAEARGLLLACVLLYDVYIFHENK